MENVTTCTCQSHLESFRIQVIPGKVPKLNLAPFKLKTAPFRVNLPKSFIWSDPKFSEADGKTRAAFSVPRSGPLRAQWSLCSAALRERERDSDP